MREFVIASMVVSATAVIITMLVLYVQLRRFQSRLPVLRDDTDLNAFKSLATGQMYASLIALVLTWIPLALWGIGKFLLAVLGWIDAILFVVVPFILQFGVAAVTIGATRAVRATPTNDPKMESEWDRVVNVWLHGDLPKW